MPTYRFKNTDNGEEFEEFMSISKLEEYLLENPHFQQMPVAVKVVHEVGTNLKADNGFREVLSHIKDRYKVNNIKDY